MEPRKGLPPVHRSRFRISGGPDRHFGPFLSVGRRGPKTRENAAQKATCTAQLAHLAWPDMAEVAHSGATPAELLFAVQTQPPPANPGHLPRAGARRCAHQAVPCAQRQDVVVAHQLGGRYFLINSLRREKGSVDSRLECDACSAWSGGAMQRASFPPALRSVCASRDGTLSDQRAPKTGQGRLASHVADLKCVLLTPPSQ
eukprot:COSAG02_NODE_3049_length_7469_cov_357.503121_10_plen_201_part_00